ncbi:GGDEF domain-containing protein [Kineococcus sp. SYSU DK002]|uniref:GGDEF domain-containing protein n=1 Tax=Kineococcus sp. SYSU DK002 TaxID=3383123 RepID=UPI003D7F174F
MLRHRSARTGRLLSSAVLLPLVLAWLWVLLGPAATVTAAVVAVEVTAAGAALAGAALSPTRAGRYALRLVGVYLAATALGDTYWLATSAVEGLRYVDGQSEPGPTVTLGLLRYLALLAVLADQVPTATTGGPAWRRLFRGRSTVVHLHLTATAAALLLLLTPLGRAIDDGTPWALFCTFDLLVLTNAAAVAWRRPAGRGRPRAARAPVLLTTAGVAALVLGDAGTVVGQTVGSGPAWVAGLCTALAGVVLLVLTHLWCPPDEHPTPSALPPVPVRAPEVLVVAGTLLTQYLAPAATAAIAAHRLAPGGAEAPGAATLGTVGTGLVLALVLAGLRVRDAHRDEHAAASARRDDLTGAYTRRGLRDLAAQVLAAEPAGLLPRPRSPRTDGWHVVLADLDGFKAVNDTHGHAAGDEVLRVVASRLAAVAEGHGVVARLGGDEFVLLVQAADEPGLSGLLHRLQTEVTAPVPLPSGVAAAVGLSTGTAAVGADGLPPALHVADVRMYAHKRTRPRPDR